MILQSTDGSRALDVGNGDLINSIRSTVSTWIRPLLAQVPLAIDFLDSGQCQSDAAQETARQINLIRDALSQVPPDEAVFDQSDLTRQAPWVGNLSPVITSCANLYTTSDGQDLLFEIVSVLVYASVARVDVSTAY